MKHKIQLYSSFIEVDEGTTESKIRRNCPGFFKTPHGKRETFSMYRGALIVRHTVQYTGCNPKRETVVYLYTDDMEGRPDTFCVSVGSKCNNLRDAKKLVDRIYETGRYKYST